MLNSIHIAFCFALDVLTRSITTLTSMIHYPSVDSMIKHSGVNDIEFVNFIQYQRPISCQHSWFDSDSQVKTLKIWAQWPFFV